LRGRLSSDQHIWLCDEHCADINVFFQSLPPKLTLSRLKLQTHQVSDHLVDNNAQEALPATTGYNQLSILTILRKMCNFPKIHSFVVFASNNLTIAPKFLWTFKRVTGCRNWQQRLTIPTSLAYCLVHCRK
ncbi:hypothetical protein MKX03_031043, partial [Papaver bracteatum]